jgi:hypothetical protein
MGQGSRANTTNGKRVVHAVSSWCQSGEVIPVRAHDVEAVLHELACGAKKARRATDKKNA